MKSLFTMIHLLDINQVIGFGLKNNKPEIALRNPLKNNIIIYTFRIQ